jgi:hypothetical protein
MKRNIGAVNVRPPSLTRIVGAGVDGNSTFLPSSVWGQRIT